MRVAADGLFDGPPAGLRVPHSRWNDIAESDLRLHGYRIVSRSMEAGIDSFTKQWGSLFVFLQGHPEYESDTLLREYRRDMQRFLKGERPDKPDVPQHYFDAESEQRIASASGLQGDSDAQVPIYWSQCSIRTSQCELWRRSSVTLFRNWLLQIASSKR